MLQDSRHILVEVCKRPHIKIKDFPPSQHFHNLLVELLVLEKIVDIIEGKDLTIEYVFGGYELKDVLLRSLLQNV